MERRGRELESWVEGKERWGWGCSRASPLLGCEDRGMIGGDEGGCCVDSALRSCAKKAEVCQVSM